MASSWGTDLRSVERPVPVSAVLAAPRASEPPPQPSGTRRPTPRRHATHSCDDAKIGYDNNDDDDILDAGDDLQVDEDCNSGSLTLSYDNNGSLTDDGVFKYGYDAWNRLVETARRVDAYTTVATYAFDGQNRRTQKAVANSGIMAAAHDGGDETVHYYYSKQWQILETRNGSNQSTAQYVWGTRYVDELVFADLNGDPASANDCDPDATGSDPNDASPDRRYFLHQDRNWNVVAATEYAGDGVGTDGRVAERYAYTPYGEFTVLKGDAGSGELGQALPASAIGNVFFHQGLPFDRDKGSYQNRHREYPAGLQRFAQRDPFVVLNAPSIGYRDAVGLYIVRRSNPVPWTDADGLCTRGSTWLAGTTTQSCALGAGEKKCNVYRSCLCGPQYPNVANESAVYDSSSVCGKCTIFGCPAAPPPTSPPPPPPPPFPTNCCAFHNNPNLQTCMDCCDSVGSPPYPPYWEEFVKECYNNCGQF